MAGKEDQRTIYDDFDPEAPETTEFRRIFTRIMRRGQDERVRTLLFTSAERGEGKTTSAGLFAMVAAQHQGLRTCLIDADLHRPKIHSRFDLVKEPGLSEILAVEQGIEACLRRTRHNRLSVITAGSRRPFPSELLSPDKISMNLGKLKLLFDLVVIDAPPLLPVSDPAIIAREVDGVVLMVRAGKTQRDVALRAKEILDGVGANLLGAVVNNVDDVLPYYYGHGYYQYAYTQPDPGPEKSKQTPAAPPANAKKPAPKSAPANRTQPKAAARR